MNSLRLSLLAHVFTLSAFIAQGADLPTNLNDHWNVEIPSILEALENKTITGIFSDQRHSVWITTTGSIYHFEFGKSTIISIPQPKNRFLPSDRIAGISAHPSGPILLYSKKDGIYKFQPDTNSFTSLDLPSMGIEQVISVQNSNSVALLSGDRIFLLDSHFQNLKEIPRINGSVSDGISVILPPQQDYFYAVTREGGIIQYIYRQGDLLPNKELDCGKDISGVRLATTESKSSVIALDDAHGFLRVLLKDGRCEISIAHEFNELQGKGLRFTSFRSLSDNSGFVLTSDKGVFIVNGDSIITLNSNNSYFKSNDFTTAFEIEPGIIWAGSFLGASQISKSGYYKVLKLGDEQKPSVVSIDSFQSNGAFVATYDNIYQELRNSNPPSFKLLFDFRERNGISAIAASQDLLWVGFQNGEIEAWDIKTKLQACSIKLDTPRTNTPVTSIIVREDTITASHLNGTITRITDCNNIRFFPERNSDNSIIQNSFALFDTGDSIWLASDIGLFEVDIPTGRTNYQEGIKLTYSTSTFVPETWIVRTLRSANIFLSPKGRVLNQKSSLLLDNLSRQSNDPYVVYSAETELNEYLWLGTSDGIWYWDNSESIRYALAQNDIGWISLDYGASHSSLDGRIFFGGTGGLVVISNPQSVRTRKLEEISIDAVSVDGKLHQLSSMPTPIDIRIPGKDSDILFYFRSYNFWASPPLQLDARLVGYRDNWSTTHNSNVISFSNVEPGRYTLEVRPTDPRQSWPPIATRLTFTISTDRKPAWLIYLIACLILLVVIRKISGAIHAYVTSLKLLQNAEQQSRALTKLEDDYAEQIQANTTLIARRRAQIKSLLHVIEAAIDARDASGLEDSPSKALPLIEYTTALGMLEDSTNRTIFHDGSNLNGLANDLFSHLATRHDRGSRAIFLNDVTEQSVLFNHAQYLSLVILEVLNLAAIHRRYTDTVEPIVQIRISPPALKDDGGLIYTTEITDNGLPPQSEGETDECLFVSHYLTDHLGGSVVEQFDCGNLVIVNLEFEADKDPAS